MAGKPVVQEALAAVTLAGVLTNPFIALAYQDFRLLSGGDRVYHIHNSMIEPGLIDTCRFVRVLADAKSGAQFEQREAGVVANTLGVLFSIASTGVIRGVKTLPVSLMAPAIRRNRYAL